MDRASVWAEDDVLVMVTQNVNELNDTEPYTFVKMMILDYVQSITIKNIQ